MRVGIIGLGLMGGSFALALRRARPDVVVLGSDLDAGAVESALAMGAIVEGDPRSADVVVLAVPISAMRRVLTGLAGHPGVVTDMASTKGRVMAWAASAGVDLVGGHPMCGREQAGIDAADPDIFEGAPWVLTRDEPAVTELVTAVGARPMLLDAERHDHLVAGVSHAAFALSAAYVLALSGQPDWEAMQQVAGSGFRDVSRLAAGDPGLYSWIASTNRECVAASLRAVEEALARVRREIEAGDAHLVELFEEARMAREGWARGAAAVAAAGRRENGA